MSDHFGPRDIIDIAKETKACYKGRMRQFASKGATIAGFLSGAFLTAAGQPESVIDGAKMFAINSACTIVALEGVYLIGAYTYSTAKTLHKKYRL